jgi:hypothetical protein
MTDRETCRAQRAPPIDLVVGKERLRQVIKRQSVLVRPEKPALGNFADRFFGSFFAADSFSDSELSRYSFPR